MLNEWRFKSKQSIPNKPTHHLFYFLKCNAMTFVRLILFYIAEITLNPLAYSSLIDVILFISAENVIRNR